jgi:hypothetical protein
MVVNQNEFIPSLSIPARPEGSMTGSEFASTIINLPLGPERELAIKQQFELGNVPDFMRTLCPIQAATMTLGGGKRSATYWVTPDYLCIGTDEDYLRTPMNPLTATGIADAYGAFLPTRRVVNSIFDAGDVKLLAKNLSPTDKMTTVQWFIDHNILIQQQLQNRGARPGQLIVGHKKDVVLCRALFDHKAHPAGHDDRVAIYGWCRAFNGSWEPWQPLNPESHDNHYADYSHGIRLVSALMTLDGESMTYDAVLEDPSSSVLVSDEGALADSRYPNT